MDFLVLGNGNRPEVDFFFLLFAFGLNRVSTALSFLMFYWQTVLVANANICQLNNKTHRFIASIAYFLINRKFAQTKIFIATSPRASHHHIDRGGIPTSDTSSGRHTRTPTSSPCHPPPSPLSRPPIPPLHALPRPLMPPSPLLHPSSSPSDNNNKDMSIDATRASCHNTGEFLAKLRVPALFSLLPPPFDEARRFDHGALAMPCARIRLHSSSLAALLSERL